MLKITEPFFVLRRITDYFTENHLISGSYNRHRAQILAGSMLLISLCSMILFVTLVINALTNPDLMIGITITALGSVFYSACLFVLKYTGRTTCVAHTFVASLYLSLLVSSYVSGGPEASSAQIMFFLPLLMFFTTGIQGGFIWSMIILITQLLIYLAYWNGFEFMQTMTTETRIEQSLLHWLIALFGIMSISWVYEHANQRLAIQKNLRDIDNRFLSDHDLLTGLNNRPAFEKYLSQNIKLADRQKNAFSVIIIQVGNLQAINRQFSYSVGDEVLRELSKRLQKLEASHIARISGSCFALITPLASQPLETDQYCSHCLTILTKPVSMGAKIVSMSINMGISHYFQHPQSSNDLFLNAESALQAARDNPLHYSE